MVYLNREKLIKELNEEIRTQELSKTELLNKGNLANAAICEAYESEAKEILRLVKSGDLDVYIDKDEVKIGDVRAYKSDICAVTDVPEDGFVKIVSTTGYTCLISIEDISIKRLIRRFDNVAEAVSYIIKDRIV